LYHQFGFRGEFVSGLIGAEGELLLEAADDGVGEGMAGKGGSRYFFHRII
jgi:hypothetical protein